MEINNNFLIRNIYANNSIQKTDKQNNKNYSTFPVWNSYDTFVKSEDNQDKAFFDYETRNFPIRIVKSFGDIPQGSHKNSRDARFCDISNVVLTEEQLLNTTIDKTTILSPKQKTITDKYTEKMKDPGLGIKDLHNLGITGKGIKMAIIDQPLGEHEEYSSNIVGKVNDINCKKMGWTKASMHGASVSSIAVGKTIGVAPDAKLSYYSATQISRNPKDIETYKKNFVKNLEKYKDDPECQKYIKEELAKIDKEGEVPSNKPYADAINKILDENKKLPKNERVSVISVSWGFNKNAEDYKDIEKAVERAKKEGVFVISTALFDQYGMDILGANRNPKLNPNNPNSYEIGAFLKEQSELEDIPNKEKILYVPMDHRTLADFKDSSSYRYEGNEGGMSWAVPWFAGMYALAKQVDSDITPEKFWNLALKTSDKCYNNDSGKHVGQIINPKRLITEIQKSKVN